MSWTGLARLSAACFNSFEVMSSELSPSMHRRRQRTASNLIMAQRLTFITCKQAFSVRQAVFACLGYEFALSVKFLYSQSLTVLPAPPRRMKDEAFLALLLVADGAGVVV